MGWLRTYEMKAVKYVMFALAVPVPVEGEGEVPDEDRDGL